MPVYEVLDVWTPAETAGPLLGSYIDVPEKGSTGDAYTLQVIGWVVGRRSKAVSVEVVYRPEPDHARPGRERVVRTTPVRGPRDDVAAHLGLEPPGPDCHFESLVGVIGFTPTFDLHLRAVLEDGTRVPIGSLRVRHEPLRTSFEPALRPIMVTCLGRTGTTWVMRMLAANEQIVVYRQFPFESSPAKYWVQMLKVLAEPSNIVDSAHPDTFHASLWWTGHNPFYDDRIENAPEHRDWFARRYPERLAEFCQRSIDDWYLTVARTQGQSSPVYFAEKNLWPTFIPVLLRELYPQSKEIFLVRDFRDMALSILAFDQKRGWPGFGRRDGTTDEQYISEVLKPAALSIANGWRTRGSRSHLLRYEDLVLRPRETLRSLLEYLELDSSEPVVEEMIRAASVRTAEVERHRTIQELEASIGRWRRERDDGFRAFCQEEFREELALFGYPEE
jgi:hypothetical protein